MILVSTLAGGVVIGWYGYCTLRRIEVWGEKMNEIDAIYQSVAAEHGVALRDEAPRAISGSPVVAQAATRVAMGLPH